MKFWEKSQSQVNLQTSQSIQASKIYIFNAKKTNEINFQKRPWVEPEEQISIFKQPKKGTSYLI